ncbi:MAG: hypothetical protein ACK56F_23025, partial [bacterium]
MDTRAAALCANARELTAVSHQLAAVREVCVDALAQGVPTPLAAAVQDFESQRALLQPLQAFVAGVGIGMVTNTAS